MDLSLSDEQKQLQESAERFVRDKYTFENRRKIAATEKGWLTENWAQFADLGWLAIPFSEEDGGIGVYTVSNSTSAVFLAAFFGVVGFVLMRLDCEPAPMILGFVLGPLMEENLRRTMMISFGDPPVFFTRPISAAFMIAAVLLLLVIALPSLRAKREEAMQE